MKTALVCVAAVVMACGGPQGGYKQGKATTAQDVVARLAQLRAERTSFQAESVMDYWLGNDRLKGTVLVMGTDKRQVRFNALSPQGGGVLADMACDGNEFSYVDFQNNCQLAGPCNRSSIGQLLRVELEPDDFLRLALGTPPVLENAKGTVTWDANKGHERVKLESPQGTQTIVIDARDGRYDVLSSELRAPDGAVVWSVENTDFQEVKDEAGKTHRLPGKTRFKSVRQKADLLVVWTERRVNVEIAPAKFAVAIPAGLGQCGRKPATASP